MTDDAELLRQYAQSGSETAFAGLVEGESTRRFTEDNRSERTAAALYGPHPRQGAESREAGHEHTGSGGLPPWFQRAKRSAGSAFIRRRLAVEDAGPASSKQAWTTSGQRRLSRNFLFELVLMTI